MVTETSEKLPPRPEKGLFSREEPTLDEGGNIIRGGMWPSARKWWELPNFVRLLVGGYGSGKSMQLCKRHIELALENAPVATAIVSPTYNVAKETIITTLIELLDAQKIIQKAWGCHLDYTYMKSTPYEFKITHQGRNKSGDLCAPRRGRLLVYSGEDPSKLKGTNLSSAGIDEPFIQELAVFEQMIARVRHRKARKLEVNLTGTPEQLNWGYDLAEGELRHRYDVGVVQISTFENKALSAGYVERLLAAFDPRVAEAYLRGQFVNLAKGLVYYSFFRNENVVDLGMPPGVEMGVGMDFNVNPMCAAPFWFRLGRQPHIHFFDEIELPNSDTQDMCGLLRERYWDMGLREVYPDSNAGRQTNSPGGKTDYHFIEEAGFSVNRFVSGNPLRRDRYNAANGMLREYKGRVRMTISPKCKKMINYLMSYSHEMMQTDSQKAMSHLLDAMTYPVANLFPADKNTMTMARLRGL